ncbi:E3 ubiquitin-protein ligase RFWD3-like [Drosophila kikkawai]|uniref:E3 ubiquitin-protein ligase RFWD3-like n=1 Tax=Drosophila kikkawai TaxID=30033 RepID=A0A6P4IB64_DROKI|nr:E3 ubiquitin-protein ligase RFWD3-like [Drosophila kikkawai]
MKLLIPVDSFNFEDPFYAEQFEWLLQWSKLHCGAQDDSLELTDLQMQLLSAKNQNERLALERDQLSKQLQDEQQDKQDLQKAIEKVTYDLQFASSQKEQLTIERDGMILRLEELNAQNQSIVAKLEAQIGSMQAIISESQQQIQQKEELRRQLLNNLDAQERAHLQEIEKLKQSLENNNLDSISCSICLEVWNESGAHRVVSVACGHLFGDSCIRSYLSQYSMCPICRQVAYIQDLRYIFGRRILSGQQ